MTIHYAEGKIGNKFIKAMISIGLRGKIRHWRGRSPCFYRGPAVVVGDDQKPAIAAAAHEAGILLAYDQLGRDLVIYPRLPSGEPLPE